MVLKQPRAPLCLDHRACATEEGENLQLKEVFHHLRKIPRVLLLSQVCEELNLLPGEGDV